MRKLFYADRPKGEQEKVLLDFILARADKVALRRMTWREWFFIKAGHDEDPRFTAFESRAHDSLIKRMHGRVVSGDATFQEDAAGPEHYEYHLDKRMNGLLKKEGLFFFNLEGGNFCGFEDPVFFKGDRLFASVITHHRLVGLWLTESEQKVLSKKLSLLPNR